ncbi:MAG: c-type cytochrome [Sphingobacteriales bacterium]|nr:c-type cytochrome [Sphingobacteriales bacterium]
MQKSFGKRVLKWLGISFLSIFLLVALIYTVVYLSTQNRIDKIYNVTVQDLTIPSDSLSYEKGRHIAQNRGCMGCHGENLAGKEVFLPPGSPMGTLVASNITSGKGGIQYDDKDWIRILRHGVNKEGKSVWLMPSHEFCHLSNSDMRALISYVKNQPPVNNTVPKKEIKPLGRLMVFLNKFPCYLLSSSIIVKNMQMIYHLLLLQNMVLIWLPHARDVMLKPTQVHRP